jgi:NADH dehydrogenase/NADH:ubiquinone oxidoreductase subunit G
VTWDEALSRAGELLGQGGGVLASAGLSNEAFWILQRLAPRLPAALWPAAGQAWPIAGRIENLARCKAIVVVGLDVWNDLPILALWIRKAVQAGAPLVVLGDQNGLARDTAHWLRGEPLATLEPLLGAVENPSPRARSDVAAAAAALRGQQPVAVLAHPSLMASGRGPIEQLVSSLGGSGDSGFVGAPLLGANGGGAALLAPDLVRGDTLRVLASTTLLAIGDEPWADLETGSFARVVLATSQAVPEDARIDVVLPMAHAYERQGSLINLEGRLQHQAGGAIPPPRARADWGIVAGIAQQLGATPAPTSLDIVRSLIADEHPALAEALRARV